MIIKESNSFGRMCIARVTNSQWRKQSISLCGLLGGQHLPCTISRGQRRWQPLDLENSWVCILTFGGPTMCTCMWYLFPSKPCRLLGLGQCRRRLPVRFPPQDKLAFPKLLNLSKCHLLFQAQGTVLALRPLTQKAALSPVPASARGSD